MRTRCAKLLLARVKAKQLKKSATLLYLAGADLARDLAAELAEKGFTVITHTTYRMVPVSRLPQDACDAFMVHRDRGGTALFPPQRAGVPGCGAGRGR